jgi:hypothetical protein
MPKIENTKYKIKDFLLDQIKSLNKILHLEQNKVEPDEKKLNNYKSRIAYAKKSLDKQNLFVLKDDGSNNKYLHNDNIANRIG